MCENISPYETIKTITGIAAPTITIFSALLGLFTKTRIEDEISKTEKFTKWAWWSLAGIILGGLISIWSVINDKQIQIIEACLKAERDSIYTAKVDSANLQLKNSRDTLRNILNYSDITVLKLRDTYAKQLLGISKQDSLLRQSIEALHPLTPLTLEIKFAVQLSNDVNKKIINKIEDFQNSSNTCDLPAYFKMKNNEIHRDYFSLTDTVKYCSHFYSINGAIKSTLPEPLIFFYKDNNIKYNIAHNKNEVYSIDGLFPTVINKKVFSYTKRYSIQYDYLPDQKIIKGKLLIEPLTPISFGNTLKSIYSIKNGGIAIRFRLFEERFSKAAKLQLRYLLLKCGEPSSEYFYTEFSEADIRKYKSESFYYKGIHSLMTGQDASGFDLLVD